MITRAPHRFATASAGLLAAGSLLFAGTACSAEDLADEVAERAIENASGEDADVEFDSDTGEFSVETDEGSFSAGGSLPDDFPSDDVPLLDGTILQAASSTQQGSSGYVVLVVVEESIDEALEAANQRLLDAGFVADPELAGIGGMDLIQVLKAPYSVLATAYETDDGTAVNYVISVE
ncbi:hypothetical protein BH09ACT12_BH09ACT12_19450 [soil metagenome]